MARTEASARVDRGEETVDFLIPSAGPDNHPALIGVNGELVRVMPGEPVRIKRKFVEAWEHSRRQEHEAWETQSRAQQASRKVLAEL